MKCSIYTCDDLSKLTATKYDVSSEVTFTGSSGELKGVLDVNDKNYIISASNYSKLPIQLESGIVKEDNKYTIDIDSAEKAKIIPENIKKDVSVLGVTGTLALEQLVMDNDIHYLSNKGEQSSSFYDVTFSQDEAYPTPSSLADMFNGCRHLKNVDLSGLDLSQVTTADNTFRDCLNLVSVSGLNFSVLTSISSMFEECSSLTSIDLSGINFSNITNMCKAFYYCTSLTDLDLSNFDSSKCSNLQYLFSGCKKLTIDLSKISIASATNISAIFQNVGSFTNSEAITTWDTSKIIYMDYAFYGTSLSGSITLNWDLSNVTTFEKLFGNTSITSCSIYNKGSSAQASCNLTDMFLNCTALTSVYLDIEVVTSKITTMFYGCTSLTTIKIPKLDISGVSSSTISYAFFNVKNCTIYVKNSTIQTLLQDNIDLTNTVVVAS